MCPVRQLLLRSQEITSPLTKIWNQHVFSIALFWSKNIHKLNICVVSCLHGLNLYAVLNFDYRKNLKNKVYIHFLFLLYFSLIWLVCQQPFPYFYLLYQRILKILWLYPLNEKFWLMVLKIIDKFLVRFWLIWFYQHLND